MQSLDSHCQTFKKDKKKVTVVVVNLNVLIEVSAIKIREILNNKALVNNYFKSGIH
jgi:hypothetical protein